MKIHYADYLQRTSLSKEELLALAWGSLILDPPIEGYGVLPAPPFLMIDRVTTITRDGNKGRIVAEQDIELDAWFFQCHFRTDPVQPGCLGVDAVWQLMGLYASACGAKGTGRALGVKEVEFFGQIRPHNKIVRYDVEIKRYLQATPTRGALLVGSATVAVDDQIIYSITGAKVGMFLNIRYNDYPHMSDTAIGGLMTKPSTN